MTHSGLLPGASGDHSNKPIHQAPLGAVHSSVCGVGMPTGFPLVLRPDCLIPSALKYFTVTSWDPMSQVL